MTDDELRAIPKDNLPASVKLSLADNDLANASLAGLDQTLQKLKHEQRKVEAWIAEQLGVCAYTMRRAHAEYAASKESAEARKTVVALGG